MPILQGTRRPYTEGIADVTDNSPDYGGLADELEGVWIADKRDSEIKLLAVAALRAAAALARENERVRESNDKLWAKVKLSESAESANRGLQAKVDRLMLGMRAIMEQSEGCESLQMVTVRGIARAAIAYTGTELQEEKIK